MTIHYGLRQTPAEWRIGRVGADQKFYVYTAFTIHSLKGDICSISYLNFGGLSYLLYIPEEVPDPAPPLERWISPKEATTMTGSNIEEMLVDIIEKFEVLHEHFDLPFDEFNRMLVSGEELAT